ncbi:MAG: hypothetical protein WAV20_05735 [Blastocatellia bacterium]
MNKNSDTPSFGEAAKALGDLLDQSAQIGIAVLGPLVSSSAKIVGGMLQSVSPAEANGCGCEIPPPCWEPRRLGEVTSLVCPGGTATVRLRVNNCNMRPTKIQFFTSGQNAGVTITPTDLTLGPMERGVVGVSLPVPASAGPGERREVLVWVRGCKDHFLRWIVEVTAKGAKSCGSDVEVDDCPDYLHHWYDHFYCHRHCTSDDQRG